MPSLQWQRHPHIVFFAFSQSFSITTLTHTSMSCQRRFYTSEIENKLGTHNLSTIFLIWISNPATRSMRMRTSRIHAERSFFSKDAGSVAGLLGRPYGW